jgi:glycerol 2-dehydrogenase (NADP+)
LNNGVEIPAIGFGTWGGLTEEGRKAVKDVVVSALKAGHRHIDTAWFYKTEKYVGEAIRESGVPRKEIFITSKLAWIHQGKYEKVNEAFEKSLKNLQTGYINLYIIHWPQSFVYEGDDVLIPRDANGDIKFDDSVNFTDSWAALEQIYASGRIRAIGVSNFSVKTLDELLKTAKIVPAVNQVELHPYLTQEHLRQYCKEKGIHITAYTPTGWTDVLEHPVIVELAKKYNATSAQVIFAWHIARETSLATFSKQPSRHKESLEIPTIDAADVERISALDLNQRVCNAPDASGKFYGWSLEQLGWDSKVSPVAEV